MKYRVFFVGQDGHFSSSEVIECAADAEAIEIARQLADGHDVELWEQGRFIVRVPYDTEETMK